MTRDSRDTPGTRRTGTGMNDLDELRSEVVRAHGLPDGATRFLTADTPAGLRRKRTS